MDRWRTFTNLGARWLLPRGMHDVLDARRRRKAMEPSAAQQALLTSNQSLVDAHRGQRCFIVCTGPSIKTQDLTGLATEQVIAVSNFFVHPQYEAIAPAYHCFVPYHPPITEAGWQTWMDEAAAKTGDAKLLMPLCDRERNEQGGRLDQRRRHYFHLSPISDAWSRRDPLGPLPTPQSVSIMALVLAFVMGFERVVLLGVDHDWILSLDAGSHFYEESEHALVRAGYNEKQMSTDLGHAWRSYDRLWLQYREVRRWAEDIGVSVVNATPGGLLDMFPRVRLEDELGRPVSSGDEDKGGK